MRVREIFERGKPLGHEQRSLPAKTYNGMRLLLDYSEGNSVFVPLRSMQYLAVIDREEVIFVDATSARRVIEFAWQEFRQGERDGLSEPVNYRFEYYKSKALEVAGRVQGEFDRSVQRMLANVNKEGVRSEGTVIGFPVGKE